MLVPPGSKFRWHLNRLEGGASGCVRIACTYFTGKVLRRRRMLSTGFELAWRAMMVLVVPGCQQLSALISRFRTRPRANTALEAPRQVVSEGSGDPSDGACAWSPCTCSYLTVSPLHGRGYSAGNFMPQWPMGPPDPPLTPGLKSKAPCCLRPILSRALRMDTLRLVPSWTACLCVCL